MWNMLWNFFILHGYVTLVVDGDMTVNPQNQIAVVGHRTVISWSCTADTGQTLTWHRRLTGRSLFSNAISATDGLYTESVNDTGRHHLHLVIESVQPTDAGQYKCTRNHSDAVSNLLVLDVVPNCTVSLLGDLDEHLTMRCRFSWWRDFKADLPWFDPAGVEFLRTHFSVAVDQFTSTRSLVVASLQSTDDSQTSLFHLSLADDRNEPPGYVFNWSAVNVMAVVMSVRNVRIRRLSNYSDDNNELYVGEEVICEADGQPDVQFHWEKDPLLTLSSPGKHVLRCTASHRIRGEYYSKSAERTVYVVSRPRDHTEAIMAPQRSTSNDSLSSSLSMVIVLSVAAVMIVTVIAVATAYVVGRRRITPRPDEMDVVYHGTQSYVTQQVLDESARRLTNVDESDVLQHTYDDVDDPTTKDSSDELQTSPVREQTNRDTTPKSVYESLNRPMLDLHSCDMQAVSVEQPTENYISICDIDQLSTGRRKDSLNGRSVLSSR